MTVDDNRTSEERADDRPAGEALRLDGNAAAGILSEVFASDVTAARATCANCGTTRALGALPVYAHGMGTVIRCPGCDAIVMRVARTREHLWLDPTGAALLVMPGAAEAPSIA